MSQEITVASLRECLQSGVRFQLVDVRSAAEYAAGHVPCAVNIPLEQVGARLADLTEHAQLVLICERGQRANTAAAWLCDRHDVLVLQGGTRAWRDAGCPVVSSTASTWSLERQIRLVAGAIVLVASLLAWFVNPLWVFLAAFVGGGLTLASLTGLCPMGMALARMPWNRPTTAQGPTAVNTCCSQPEQPVKQ